MDSRLRAASALFFGLALGCGQVAGPGAGPTDDPQRSGDGAGPGVGPGARPVVTGGAWTITPAYPDARAGRCFGPIRVGQVDESGAPLVPPANANGILLAPPGFELFADEGCLEPVDDLFLETSFDLYARTERAGVHGIEVASGNGAIVASARFDVEVLPVSSIGLHVTGGQMHRSVGVCDGPFQVVEADRLGNPLPFASDLRLLLGSNSERAHLRFFGDAACEAPIEHVDLAEGATMAEFYIVGTLAGAGSFEVRYESSDVLTRVPLEFAPGPFAQVVRVKQPDNLDIGQCIFVDFQAQDRHGNPVYVDDFVRVTAEGGKVYAKARDCSRDGPSDGELPVEGGVLVAWLRSDGEGLALDVETKDAAGGENVQRFDFRRAVGSYGGPRIRLPEARISARPGECVGPLRLDVEYLAAGPGVPVSVTGDEVIGLKSSASALSFHSDAACRTAFGEKHVTLEGFGRLDQPVDFYLRVLRAPTDGGTAYPVSAIATSERLRSTTLNVDVEATPAEALLLSSASLVAGECHAAGRATPVDGEGFFAAAGADALRLQAQPGGPVHLFQDAACADRIDEAAATDELFGRSTLSGLHPLVEWGETAAIAVSVRPAKPLRPWIDSPPFVIAAGDCVGPLRLTAYDAYDNRAPGGDETESFELQVTPGASLFRDGACQTPVRGPVPNTGDMELYIRGDSPGAVAIDVGYRDHVLSQNHTVVAR